MRQKKGKRLLRIPAVVDYLDGTVTEATIRSWIFRKQIDHVRIGGVVVIPVEALDRLIEEGRVAAANSR
jgi:hypothetical protein